jgi:hydroxymethylbilane synthase
VAASIEAGVELVPIRTSGDEGPRGGASRADPGDKSRFVKEIEEALLDGEVDLAVHSAKDVPGVLPEGLSIVGVPERADARDALCGALALDDLAEGATVGTSSLRRRAQLLALRPDVRMEELRGNVDTRLRKLAEGRYDAVVLALAGLERLGRSDEGSPLPADALVPASGQGCLALEARSDDHEMRELGAQLTDQESLVRLMAERALVAALDATCRTPVAAHASLLDGGGELVLDAFVGLPDGSTWIRDSLSGDPGAPTDVGVAVAERLLAAGAADVREQAEAVIL